MDSLLCTYFSSKNIVSALSVLISLTCYSNCSLVFVIAVMVEIAEVFVSSFIDEIKTVKINN